MFPPQLEESQNRERELTDAVALSNSNAAALQRDLDTAHQTQASLQAQLDALRQSIAESQTSSDDALSRVHADLRASREEVCPFTTRVPRRRLVHFPCATCTDGCRGG